MSGTAELHACPIPASHQGPAFQMWKCPECGKSWMSWPPDRKEDKFNKWLWNPSGEEPNEASFPTKEAT